MPARVSRFKIRDGSYGAVMSVVNTTLCERLKRLEGLQAVLSTLNRDTNEGTVIAAYRDRAAMDAARAQIAEIWGSLARSDFHGMNGLMGQRNFWGSVSPTRCETPLPR